MYEINTQGCKHFCPQENQYYDGVSNQCEVCDTTCRTCVDGGKADCLTCPSGYYLDNIEDKMNIGTCSPKTPSSGKKSPIFVSNSDTFVNNGNSNTEREGTEDNPFINLRDALVKADELAAPFSDHSVSIYLTPGTHHVI